MRQFDTDGTDPFSDPFGDAPGDDTGDDAEFVNTFTDEIANVTASDWELDADELWGSPAGGDLEPDAGFDSGAAAYDIPL